MLIIINKHVNFCCFRAVAYTTLDRLCAVFLYNESIVMMTEMSWQVNEEVSHLLIHLWVETWLARLTKRIRELIPETGWCIFEWAICDFQCGDGWWARKGDNRWGAPERILRGGCGHRRYSSSLLLKQSSVTRLNWLQNSTCWQNC